ncbi:MAG: triphosphoribosyl-dephospho-CoA synthase MdcB [Pseudomonadota bacterium]
MKFPAQTIRLRMPNAMAAAFPPPSPADCTDRADAQRWHAHDIACLAVRSLHAELCLYPKPGLVSLVDSGSHDDMDAETFMRSLFSLRHYFKRICLAGMDDAPFARLKQLGIAAETAMLAATRGINTHRGAIFSLGLLCAAAGRAHAGRTPMSPISPESLRATLLHRWRDELAAHANPPLQGPGNALADAASPGMQDAAPGLSNGLRVAIQHAAAGAREEGARGLPSVFEVGLPALQATLARGGGMHRARVDALYALMAHVSDTNIYHRAGPQGAQTVRAAAQRFLALGGTANPGWRLEAEQHHRRFKAQRLSPGGAADLLAATCLVHAIACRDAR